MVFPLLSVGTRSPILRPRLCVAQFYKGELFTWVHVLSESMQSVRLAGWYKDDSPECELTKQCPEFRAYDHPTSPGHA